MKRKLRLSDRYPPSEPCSCGVCVEFCGRPGWWTVAEAARAVAAGQGTRMMLEMSEHKSFGVLAPAFKGCELSFALEAFANRGCTFLVNDRCGLFGTGLQPLECRFCHHDRPGQGALCHADIGRDWDTRAGRDLVVRWAKLTGLWDVLGRAIRA